MTASEALQAFPERADVPRLGNPRRKTPPEKSKKGKAEKIRPGYIWYQTRELPPAPDPESKPPAGKKQERRSIT